MNERRKKKRADVFFLLRLSRPPAIRELSQLRTVVFSDNKIVTLPAELFELPLLERLDVSGNLIASLPALIENLSSLRVLQISRNKLVKLPDELGSEKLDKLHTIEANQNALVEIPAVLAKLPVLSQLSVSGNAIAFLPNELCVAKALKVEKKCTFHTLKSVLPDARHSRQQAHRHPRSYPGR